MQENALQSENKVRLMYHIKCCFMFRHETVLQICTNDTTQRTCETPLVVASFLMKLCLLGQGQYDFIQFFSLKVCIDFTSSVSTEYRTDATKLN